MTQPKPRVLALIVARGGSKGIPRKNLFPLEGQPLIAYTFEAVLNCKSVVRAILSTDDDELSALALRHGIEVPFRRPADLASDSSHIMDATIHALDWLEKNESYTPDYCLLLQPTSPLRSTGDIDAAIALAVEKNADAVVSVTETRQHPCLTKSIDPGGHLKPFIDTAFSTSPRQQLPPVYSLNGAIYLVRVSVLRQGRSWCPEGATAYVMPFERSIDIDSPLDIAIAGALLRHQTGTI